MSSILITGGAGFIGSNFVRYMLDKYSDYDVVNLDALTYCGNLENLKDIEDMDNYTFVKGDIRDKELVDDLVSKLNDCLKGKRCLVVIDDHWGKLRTILQKAAFLKEDRNSRMLITTEDDTYTDFYHLRSLRKQESLTWMRARVGGDLNGFILGWTCQHNI